MWLPNYASEGTLWCHSQKNQCKSAYPANHHDIITTKASRWTQGHFFKVHTRSSFSGEPLQTKHTRTDCLLLPLQMSMWRHWGKQSHAETDIAWMPSDFLSQELPSRRSNLAGGPPEAARGKTRAQGPIVSQDSSPTPSQQASHANSCFFPNAQWTVCQPCSHTRSFGHAYLAIYTGGSLMRRVITRVLSDACSQLGEFPTLELQALGSPRIAAPSCFCWRSPWH